MATAVYDFPDTPFFLQVDSGTPITYTAAQFRRYTGALSRRTGVLGPSHFLVQQADNVGFKVKVNSGYARVGGTGFNYLVSLGSDVEISLSAFDTNPPSTRNHRVFIAVFDGLLGGTEYRAKILITEDTSGGGAPNPVNAAAYLEIATITIAKNQPNIQNSNITNTARHGGAAGEYLLLNDFLVGSAYVSNGSADGTAEFRAIYHDGFVRLSGSIRRVDNKPFPGDSDFVIGTMHSNLRPSRKRYLTCPCAITEPHTTTSGTYTCRLQIDPDGTMTIAMPVGQSPLVIFFDGVTYDLDGNSGA